jgi:Ca2+-binding RTX toxin-like protein
MDEVDSDTFAVSLSLDDYADGDYIFLVRARDAEGNVSVEAETNLTVSRRVDAELDTSSLEITGLVNETVTVGTTLTVGGATATGNPEPELTYQWNLCPQAGDCVTYDGNSYSPLESEIGWTVELEIRAYNGADGEPSSDVRFLGWVSAATVEEEEGGFGDPPADPAPAPAPTPVTPAPTPEPTPVDPTPAPEGRTVWGERSNPVKQVIVAANLDDVIRTGSGNDTIRSFGGNDTIFSGRGGDFVYAGSGNDVIWAQHGHATVYCGPGTDRVYANRFVRTVGCETVIVANNNRWAQVKLNSKGFPIMPTGFVKPYFKG